MLEKQGLDGMQCQHWTLYVPEEYIAPGLEVGIVAGPGGLQIGGELIKWEDLEVAKLRARGSTQREAMRRINKHKESTMNDENEKAQQSPGREAPEISALLATFWIDALTLKPPRGCFVLCDGMHIKTMVVAAWNPESENDEFPWKISDGGEIHEYADDTISRWMYLPASLCC